MDETWTKLNTKHEQRTRALPLNEFLGELRRGTGEYWEIDHLMLRAADVIERLRALLIEVYNHGETFDLHARIGDTIGGVDATGCIPPDEPSTR